MNSVAPAWLWGFFLLSVLAALFIDFVVLSKPGAQKVSVKEAIRWSVLWIALSLAFNTLFWWALAQSPEAAVAAQADMRAMEFLTGYLIEKSLAVDNIFIFLMIFTYSSVPPAYQKRVLPVSKEFDGEKFWTTENGKHIATPLLMVGITDVILVFIGAKMLLIDVYKIPVLVSLGVVVGVLAITMVWSVRTAPRGGDIDRSDAAA